VALVLGGLADLEGATADCRVRLDLPVCAPTSRNCLPQPGIADPAQFLDILSYRQRPTFRLAYRNFKDYEALVTSQSVEATPGHRGHALVRDQACGGRTASTSNVFPGIRYTGRPAGDPLGQMTLGEGTIVNGAGVQTTTNSRWGDYTDMTVDPTDDCTFWYVNEY
jgi:hypothetical protein